MQPDQNNNQNAPGESLEPASPPKPTSTPEVEGTPDTQPKKPGTIKKLFGRFNIYLVIFVFILIIAGVIIILAISQSKNGSNNSNAKTTNLTNSTLQQIANSDAKVGGPQEVLNVESNAVFAGKVLVNQGLDVAGQLQVSGTVALSGLDVSGDAQLQSANVIQALSVGGTLGVSGPATFNQGLQVSGSGSFSGSLTASSLTASTLTLNGELVLDHHLSVGGASPSSSNGPALGSGGTASINGSDTSGAINISTGGGPSAGCLIFVKFNQAYSQTPYVIVSPIGASAGGLSYYVTATTSGFNLCLSSAPPASSSFGFDYFIDE